MKKIIFTLIFLSLNQFCSMSQWTLAPQPTTSNLYSLFFTSATTGFISGDLNGGIYKTTDGASSYQLTPTGMNSWFLDMYFINALTGFASGQNGTIVKTSNAGQNWSIVLSSAPFMHSIRFPSAQTGYAVGSNGIYKSTNGGNTWFALNDPYSDYLLGVCFLNDNTGFICGAGNRVAKTTDGGISWTSLLSGGSDSNEEVVFTDNNTGYIAGNPGKIIKTTNGGTNWQSLTTGTTQWLFDIYMVDNSTGWACGANGTILKTGNGGANWALQPTAITNNIRQIHFTDSNTGYAVCDGGKILKTTNGGGTNGTSCFTNMTGDPIVNDNAWGEGCAWGDYDNDGYQDLVVTNYNDNCQSCNNPILLYHNNGNGSFTKITTGPIASENTRAFGCSWGDYDNDGRLDLFVSIGYGLNNLLFHNDGNGNFTKVTSGAIVNDGGFSVSCCWLDYDRDGWLDLFVLNQGNNFLYHNNGNGTFTRITSGGIVNSGLQGRSCAVGDYDNDGWPDIIVTSWAGPVVLYHNNQNGTFTATSGVIPNLNAYYDGVSFGDYDNDGWQDLFICSINSGNNVLLHNNGGTFSQVSVPPSQDTGPLSFGCTWADYDNDGYLDLFVANNGNHNFLYKNNNGTGFTRISNEPIVTDFAYGIGCSFADINSNGKTNFFVANNGSTNPQNDLMYLNTCNSTGNYIGLKLRGCALNKSAIGAKVIIKAGGHSYLREVSGGGGYHSQNMLWPLIGIGTATIVDTIIVKWTTGNIQRLTNISPNQYLTIDECLVGIAGNNNQIPLEYSLLQNYPNPFNPTTKIKFELPSSNDVTLKVYDNLGNEVITLINSRLNAGYYEADFKGENLSSGIYFYKLVAGSYIETKKMVLVK